MGVLTQQAYEVTGTDPVTGGFIYAKYPDDSACPAGVLSCTGQPVVKSPRFVARVKGYQGLIDYMQQVSKTLGFDDPSLRGVF
jgi:hypothetical protein